MGYNWSEMKLCYAINWWQNNGNFNMKLYQKFLQVRYLQIPKNLKNEKQIILDIEKRTF